MSSTITPTWHGSARSPSRRAKAIPTSSASLRATTSPPPTIACTSSTPRPSPASSCVSARSPSRPGCASTPCSSRAITACRPWLARRPSAIAPLWSADPRLAMRAQVHRRLVLSAAAGLFHQPPEAADLGARFGNPTLGASRALVVTGGGEVRVAGPAHRRGHRLLSPARRSGIAQRAAVAAGRRGAGAGRQRSQLRRPAPGAPATVARVLRLGQLHRRPRAAARPSDLGDAALRLRSDPHPHVVAGYEWRRWQFGARLRYSTGFPRTPVIGAYFDARDNRFDPLFGAIDSTRIPGFVQLDLRVERAFVWSRATLDLPRRAERDLSAQPRRDSSIAPTTRSAAT